MCAEDDPQPPAAQYKTPGLLRPVPTASSGEGELVVEPFPLTFEGYTYQHGRIAYIRGRRPSPVVLVYPNYAGLKQFDIDQACFLARAGYVGVAVDLFKEIPSYRYEDRNPEFVFHRRQGKGLYDVIGTVGGAPRRMFNTARHFANAFSLMNDLIVHTDRWRGLMAANLEAAQRHPAVAAGLAAAIGYCFGGQCCLEHVRAGHRLQAVVTFHGVLQSRPFSWRRLLARASEKELPVQQASPGVYTSGCKVLIENGDKDQLVTAESIAEFKAEMDEHGIEWRINNHARTPHGFALAPGVWSSYYREAADRRSTLSMLSLFGEVWPDFAPQVVATNACGTTLGQCIRLLPDAAAKAKL